MCRYAEMVWEEEAAAEAVEDAAKYDAWAATPEGQKALLDQERAKLKAERAALEQERAWGREHPTEWAAWLTVQPYLFPGFGYEFEQFLAEVGKAEPGERLVRKDDRFPFQSGNMMWATGVPIRQVESPYLTADEAAAYCRVSKKTLYNRRAEIGSMPGSRKLRFTREALDKWTQARRKATRTGRR